MGELYLVLQSQCEEKALFRKLSPIGTKSSICCSSGHNDLKLHIICLEWSLDHCILNINSKYVFAKQPHQKVVESNRQCDSVLVNYYTHLTFRTLFKSASHKYKHNFRTTLVTSIVMSHKASTFTCCR